MKVLTKSKFKLGLECPNKLFYTGKPGYANTKKEDSFLAALAQGGFQVEELARLQFSDGIFIDTEHGNYEEAVLQTKNALQKGNAVIFEAAFLFDGLFIQTDILVKKGNHIKLIEVKAKSFDPNDDYLFFGKRDGMKPGWKPYLFDLAFQKYVIQQSRREFQVEAWLMMADKTKAASVNGLNQMFRIPKNGNPRTGVIKNFDSVEELGSSVLSEKNVDDIINGIISNKYKYSDKLDFGKAVKLFCNAYQNNEFINWPTNFSVCKKCEFKATQEEEANGLKSGFKYCFSQIHQWKNSDFEKPNAFEIWDFKNGNKLMDEDKLFLDDITEEDLKVKTEPGKISHSERQMTQVEKSRDKDDSVYVLKDELTNELNSWVFPLHFIDFETSAVALPFHAGRKPYEQIAFQFSHHQYNKDGTIEHKSEFINVSAGEFPNFKFARALYQDLRQDNGTIFRYATHENTILNHIIRQLDESQEEDKVELIAFFKDITTSTNDNPVKWKGNRNMVDLCDIVKDYYYNPFTKGSNSIKQVLPACLNSSEYLKEKYSQPIGKINLTSTNFADSHIWLEMDGTAVKNPYKMLPELFPDWTDEQLEENLAEIEVISDGGAALTAYGKLQYQDMTKAERDEITCALLKYCELDTLAMVMIYEHFRFDLL